MRLFLLLFLFSISLQLLAQTPTTDTTSHQLREVVVASEYLADEKTPLTFQNIESAAFEPKNTGQEPSFLLGETPSMTVYSDAGSYQGYSYFRLRGIDQTRLNMTLDGVPLNEPEDQGVYFSNYPDFFNSIDQVQIQRGVGTSKNGTSSYGGSLQFSSPNLFDSTRTSFGIGYGSYQTYRVFGEYNSGIKNQKGLYVRASHLHSDGYKDRSANTSFSGFYSGGLLFKNSSLKLTGFAGNQRNQMAWLGVSQDSIDQNPRSNANSEEDDNFSQSLTQLQHKWYISERSSLKTSVFYNFLNGNYDFDLNNFLGFPSTEELYNYAFKSHFGGAFSNYTYELPKLKWTSGIQTNVYTRKHTGSELTFGQLYENKGFKNEFSAFSKINYALNDFMLYADLQYRYTDFDYKGTAEMEQLNWHFLNPKAGLTYKVNDNIDLYYSIGQTSREPTRNDMFGGSDDLPVDSLGAAILFITDPERLIDHELGFRLQTKKLRTNLNLYWMDFKNEIILNGQFGPNGLALNSKVENSFRTGVELDLTYQPIEQLRLVNNSSFNYSQIKEQEITFAPILTPKLIINQEVIYVYKNLETGISARYQSSSFLDFANENSLEDYFLLNWRAAYKVKNWRFSLLVNNLTNTRYYNNGYVDYDGTNKYFIQAPINFYGMVNFTF